MTAADLKAGLCCSFCMKLPAQVAKLVAGPGVFICNECVDLCNHVIAQAPERPPGVAPDSDAGAKVEAWHKRFSDDDMLNHLPKVAAASAQVEQQLTTWVREARGRGITWTRIGEALSMTRQSAWERFSGED